MTLWQKVAASYDQAHVLRALEVAAAGDLGVAIIYPQRAPAQELLDAWRQLYQAAGYDDPPDGQVIAIPCCPCGNYTAGDSACVCPTAQLRKYWRGRREQAFRQTLVIAAVVPAVDMVFRDPKQGEPLELAASRVVSAREYLDNRGVAPEPWQLPRDVQDLLRAAYMQYRFGLQDLTKTIMIATTVAAMEGQEKIQVHHAAEAIQYRYLHSLAALA